MMRQTQDRLIDDFDGSSMGSLSGNEEEVRSFPAQKSTVLDQRDQNSNSSQFPKFSDPTSTLQPCDFNIMVQNYKQIGGELEYNLKLLETKWQSLNKIHVQTTQDYELLNKQKEFQMKKLVDLQIKLETLDTERMKMIGEWERSRVEMTEEFGGELQLIFDNYDCITNTHSQFNVILMQEKHEFNNLLSYCKNVIEHHKQAGEDYCKQIQEVKTTSVPAIHELIGKESKLQEELCGMLEKCRTYFETGAKLKEDIKKYEMTMSNSQKRSEALKIKLAEQRKNLKESEDYYNKITKDYKEKLESLNLDIKNEQNIYEKLMRETEIKESRLLELKSRFELLTEESKMLESNITKVEQDLIAGQKELLSLEEEMQSLLTELNRSLLDEANFKDQASKLPELLELLEATKLKEIEASSNFELIKDALSQSEGAYSDVYDNQQQLEGKENELVAELENITEEFLKSEQELLEQKGINAEECSNIEKALEDAYKELSCLEEEIEENDKIQNDLNNEIIKLENDAQGLQTVINCLEDSKQVLDSETQHLDRLDKEVSLFNEEFAFLEESERTLEKELEDLQNALDQDSPKELENELLITERQIKDAHLHYREQLNNILNSYESQRKNWEEKAANEVKDIEKSITKNENMAEKFIAALPRLDKETSALETNVDKLLPSLVKEIRQGIHSIEEIARFYFTSFTDARRRGAKASLVRYLAAIEEQLVRPMKCMMSLPDIPQINLEKPPPEGYAVVIKAFKEKYNDTINLTENIATLETARKLQEIGYCMFGMKWVKPTFANILNETEISSSTNEVP